MSGFQTRVNAQLPLAVEGDFASTNPRASVPPVLGGAWKVAAAQSVRCGFFAWGGVDGLVYSSSAGAGAGAVLGFVGRQANEPSAMITAFLAESIMTLQAGTPCTLFASGDYYVNLPGVTMGASIYADVTTGAPTLTAGGNTDSGFKGASVSKVNAVSNATPGVSIAAQTGVMTVAGANASGVIEVGQRVTGGGLPAGVIVTALGTGTGGAGTYQTNYVNRAAVAAFVATFVQGDMAKISKT